MKINRLFEIVYILIHKKTVTARELSERFEVSIRTIYRDMEILSSAGIPIYTNKGKGGGISLMEDFVLDKSMISKKEQNEILMSLQGLNALRFPDIEPIFQKLSTLFKNQGMNWIDVDFSRWGSNQEEKRKFNSFKTAILNKNMVVFEYFNSYGEKSKRTVEPMKLLFKGQSWYIYGFCKNKNDFRIFKITRIKNIDILKETFERDIPKEIWEYSQEYKDKMIKMVLKVNGKMAYRIYDEFDEECIAKNEDGSFTIIANLPEEDWIYGYVMSYGEDAELLAPKYVREMLKEKLEKSLKKYL